MTAPAWLNDTVREFGRQLGLARFALSEKGTAGVRFENGVALRLEYVDGRGLFVTASAPLKSAGAPGLKRLFASVHPDANRGRFTVRAAVMAHSDEASASVRIPERDVEVPAIEEAMALVWGRVAAETGGAA